MKQTVFAFLLITISLACYSQETNCTQYHRGKFIYTDSVNNVITVKRKKNFQVETNEQTGVWVNYRITWVSDCEYKLEQVGTNSKSKRKYNHTVSTTIISKSFGTEGYEYTCACKDGSKPKITGVMKSIKETP